MREAAAAAAGGVVSSAGPTTVGARQRPCLQQAVAGCGLAERPQLFPTGNLHCCCHALGLRQEASWRQQHPLWCGSCFACSSIACASSSGLATGTCSGPSVTMRHSTPRPVSKHSRWGAAAGCSAAGSAVAAAGDALSTCCCCCCESTARHERRCLEARGRARGAKGLGRGSSMTGGLGPQPTAVLLPCSMLVVTKLPAATLEMPCKWGRSNGSPAPATFLCSQPKLSCIAQRPITRKRGGAAVLHCPAIRRALTSSADAATARIGPIKLAKHPGRPDSRRPGTQTSMTPTVFYFPIRGQ